MIKKSVVNGERKSDINIPKQNLLYKKDLLLGVYVSCVGIIRIRFRGYNLSQQWHPYLLHQNWVQRYGFFMEKWLLAVGFWLLAFGCWLLAVGCLLVGLMK